MDGSGIAQFIPLILIFVIFYFFLIRPQQKRVKDHKLMVENLKRGGSDEMKRESRRNNKRNMTYNKADELNELGQKVIVQFN